MIKSIQFRILTVLILIIIGLTVYKYKRFDNIDSVHVQEQPVLMYETVTSITDEKLTSSEISFSITETCTAVCTPSDVLHENCHGYEDYSSEEFSESLPPYIADDKINQIRENIKLLSEYDDFIGWIYIDSDIDYPVVQGNDNQYYLTHSPDGNYNSMGTVFLDCDCSEDFSDLQNIIYGHNMLYGMFGSLRKLRNRYEYEKYRYGWLFTKDSMYRIDFYSLAVVSAYDTIYCVPTSQNQWQDLLREKSIYYTETEISENDSVITLSTCATDFENARLLFTGKLVSTE